jgi:hypothetical protein
MWTSVSPCGGGSIAAVSAAESVAEFVEVLAVVVLLSIATSADCVIDGVVDASASDVDVEVTTGRLLVASKEVGEDVAFSWAAASRI